MSSGDKAGVPDEAEGADAPPTSGDDRVFFRDIKPYAVVDDLDQLRGPDGGVVKLSHSVLWAPGGPYVDIDTLGGTRVAYQAVLAEGLVEDQEHVLNRRRLIAVWRQLMLDRRVRALWEDRFPELRDAVSPGEPPAPTP